METTKLHTNNHCCMQFTCSFPTPNWLFFLPTQMFCAQINYSSQGNFSCKILRLAAEDFDGLSIR